MPSFDLDETDKAIIRELQADGRMPFTRLGPLVGLSQSATRQRVNRLIESGVMQVVAVTDPHLVGLEVQAMICLRATGDLRAVADQLATLEPVEYVVITAGAYDLLARWCAWTTTTCSPPSTTRSARSPASPRPRS